MKIRHRVGLSVAILVSLMAGLAGFTGVHYARLSGSVREMFDEEFRIARAAENLIKESERLELARLRVVEGDGAGYAAFREHAAQFAAWYDEVDALTFNDPDTTLVDSIKTTFNLYLTQSAVFFRAADEANVGRLDARTTRLQGRTAAGQSAELGRQLFLLLERYQTAMDRSSRRIQRSASVGAALVWSAAGIAVLVTFLVGLQFAQAIVGPIERLTNTVRAVGRGHLGRQVDIHSRDEMGALGREFNRMTGELAAFEALNVQKLVAEKRKTESLVETMPSPVFVTDTAGRLILANHAALALVERLTGHPAPPVTEARPLGDLVPDGDLHRYLTAPLADDEAGPEEMGAEDGSDDVFALVLDGGEHFFRARHRRIDTDDADVGTLRVTLLEDVTHFKRLDQMKTDFVAAVSHELRTPLMSIGMAVDLLRDGAAGEVTTMQSDLLASVKDDQARLRRLVNGLLTLARTESGLVAPILEPVRMADVVEEAVAPLRLPYLDKGVELDVDVPAWLPTLNGDAQQLGWVVTNLVGNALKHTAQGGRVIVSASSESVSDGAGVALHLRVRDTGIGIPADALDQIFSPFVQVKDRNAATPGSVGLGLHLAQRVVHAHDGRIWAESVPGEGSTFHVELPVAGTARAVPALASTA